MVLFSIRFCDVWHLSWSLCHLVVSPSAFSVGFSRHCVESVKGLGCPRPKGKLAALLLGRNERENEIPPVQGKQKAGVRRGEPEGNVGQVSIEAERSHKSYWRAQCHVAKEITMAWDR